MKDTSPYEVDRRRVLVLAWPIILSNLSTPLLGLVDTAVIGNQGNAALIGAVAIGAMIFSFLFWGFGFLRMGTTGLIAQARGSNDEKEVKATLYRSLIIAGLIGAILITIKVPIQMLAFQLTDGSHAVESAAKAYFDVRIWAAPASLIHMVALGYLLAQQRTTSILWLQLLLNGTNIALDVLFVIVLQWGVIGVAAATAIAELVAAIAGVFLVYRHIKAFYNNTAISLSTVFALDALRRTFAVNRDIMIRTLTLIFALAWFTNEGAQRGDVLLACNAILMQFVSFSAFFLDGYALAAESLTGQAVGKKEPRLLDQTLRHISELGLATAALLSVVILLLGPPSIELLTNAAAVRESSKIYLPWVVIMPIVSVWCFLLDGVFIGSTCTRQMRNAMILSLAIYLAACHLLTPLWNNHGLWLSLMIYYIARALTLLIYLKNVRNLTEKSG